MITKTRGVVMPATRHAIAGVDDLTAAAPTLGELAAGMAAGRTSANQTTCFLNLTGIGLQFAAAGVSDHDVGGLQSRWTTPREWA